MKIWTQNRKKVLDLCAAQVADKRADLACYNIIQYCLANRLSIKTQRKWVARFLKQAGIRDCLAIQWLGSMRDELLHPEKYL